MPRALTEQEKCRQCKRLLEKGKDVVLSHGIKKVSIDEITRAAGMAKGSFYQHFESKEQYMLELIVQVHRQIFSLAERALLGGSDLRENARGLLSSLFHMPEMIFFSKYYHEIDELLDTLADHEVQSAEEMEVGMFEELLTAAGIDTQKVKPGVVHNFVHTLYMIAASDRMTKGDLPQTCALISESLLSYIFGGTE